MADSSGDRQQGKLVKWRESYGFISRRDDRDLFVHISQIRPVGRARIRTGVWCSFRVGHGPKGPAAEDVAILDRDT
jgi:CspA family cold shock protein